MSILLATVSLKSPTRGVLIKYFIVLYCSLFSHVISFNVLIFLLHSQGTANDCANLTLLSILLAESEKYFLNVY